MTNTANEKIPAGMPNAYDLLPEHIRAMIEKSQASRRLQPGRPYSHTVTARPSMMQIAMNDFYTEMLESYPNFRVISTAATETFTGACVYITYMV